MSSTSPQAVTLLSGGLDSATALAVAINDGFECHALSFNYGQRHNVELNAAKRLAAFFKVKNHVVLDIDLRQWGGSALTADSLSVPKEGVGEGIPITYVPARNLIFLAFATAWAETLGATDIFIGVNSVDYSGYPDCRPEFLDAFTRCANLGTKAGVDGQKLTIHSPLQSLTKAEIIKLGVSLGVDYGLTRSCYDPDVDGRACGQCDSCRLRAKGFQLADVPDPTPYITS